MSQVCSKCSHVNPPDASYCYYDGAVLGCHRANGGPVNAGSAPFPSPFVFPTGQQCRNFDQLAMACQQNWPSAVDLLRQGYLGSFLGGIGRVDLAIGQVDGRRPAAEGINDGGLTGRGVADERRPGTHRIDRGFDQHDIDVTLLKVDPVNAWVHTDRRFHELAHKLRLPGDN